MRRIVLASDNRGKLDEIRALLAPTGMPVTAQAELGVTPAVEDGLSFVENAILKARNAARQTGLAAIADDSGLEVDALDGEPGIYSARYAGAGAGDEANNDKLLAALAGAARRSARFQCLAVLLRHAADPVPLIARGTWEGEIVTSAAGGGGFGYDPLFRPQGEERTAAELSADEKNAVSHRARAFRDLAQQLREYRW